jgi:hypothetical protein
VSSGLASGQAHGETRFSVSHGLVQPQPCAPTSASSSSWRPATLGLRQPFAPVGRQALDALPGWTETARHASKGTCTSTSHIYIHIHSWDRARLRARDLPFAMAAAVTRPARRLAQSRGTRGEARRCIPKACVSCLSEQADCSLSQSPGPILTVPASSHPVSGSLCISSSRPAAGH